MNELDARNLLPLYEQQLLKQVMPFWEGRIDRKCGGILNCVSDSGVLQSTDKYLWSQGRALWTFSALVNRVAPEDKWRAAAENLAQFLFAHGRQPDGGWAYVLTQGGAVKIPPQSIYVDGFVLIGMTEYARMSGSEPARALALEIYERIAPRLADHGALPTEPHAIPSGFQSHGPLMIFAHAFHELGVLTGRADVLRNALALADRIMREHVKPNKQALLEFVRPGGGESDCEIGRTVVPGHAIESMWFLERIYAHHGRRVQIPQLAEVVRWHLEKGWDEVNGGLRLALGLAGGKPHWQAPDVKAWWPHVEALYALLRFHAVTGSAWCAEWYGRVHDYTFSRFPNHAHGEWFNYLDAAGNPLPPALKNLPVKDPFHLPRALILSIAALAQGEPHHADTN